MNLTLRTALLICLFLPSYLYGQPRQYTIERTSRHIDIDGHPDRAWNKVNWSEVFVDIEGDSKPSPLFGTRFKMLYDHNFLYILARMEEPHLWASLQKRDAIVFRDNDFEVFIDPDNDQQNYYEYEINALGTVMDLFMNKPYKKGGRADLKWNSEGLKSAIALDGTLNTAADADKGWTVELAIPFADLDRSGMPVKPSRGTTWRMNFSRVQWQLDISSDGYTKRKGPNGKNLPEYNWVWSPQGLIDMHVPEKWGLVHFK